MNPIKTIVAAATLSLLSLGHLGAAEAADGAPTLKPLQGVSFHAGSKHAVGYFLSESSACKLVLTMVEDAAQQPTRFEAAIAAGKSTSYELAQGKSIEFACGADAQTMKINALETIAANG